MSEYQRYEFVALDRPLSSRQMGELRAISTRADISSTRFWNEYHWGDIKADPAELLARYFDALLYVANWGTHRLMLKLPASGVTLAELRPYFPGGSARLIKRGAVVLVDLLCESDEAYDETVEEDGLAALTPLRAQLLAGDLSAAYLSFLLAVQAGDVDEAKREPPVPAGLGQPSAAIVALGQFLRLDPDLLAAAAEASAPVTAEPKALRAWGKALSLKEKDRWLSSAVKRPEAPIGNELAAAFRSATAAKAATRRTVEALLERADEIRAQREQVEKELAEIARRKAAAARRRHLTTLLRQGDKAWKRLDSLLEGRNFGDAATLTRDLSDAAELSEGRAEFERRLAALRKVHGRSRSYWRALK
jgi:hypothetical protein